ncbi:hypothetical protein [Fundidesulfovibrio terrae]|uniref:hypothetical protein n=1 Tax=Fundidesulfovibrio terrae TaxID=2922866 RepID=UPI001FAEDF52|nr:hypothetical protein [Fundidesulfovibrio terrae]
MMLIGTLDRVDLNMQSLGAYGTTLNNAPMELRVVDGTAQPAGSAAEAGPFRVQAVTEHSHAVSQTLPEADPSIGFDHKVYDRAWNYAKTGDDPIIAAEMSGYAAYDRQFASNARNVHHVEQVTGAILSLYA